MSSIYGIDSNNLVNALLNSLKNTASSDAIQNAESASTDPQQTTSDSADTSVSLLDQLKASFLQDQYSFISRLFNSNDSASSDSMVSLWGNTGGADETNNLIADNPQLAQLFDALNLSSSASGSSDLTTSLLQSLEESGLSQSNSTSMQTVMENLLKSSGNSGNSSAQEILNKYISSMSNTASLIKTMVLIHV